MTNSASCPYCGATDTGGIEGCFSLLDEILNREYNDPAYGAVNLLTEDAYALQHPEEQGAKNSPFHLLRMCWILECGGSAEYGQSPAWLEELYHSMKDIPALQPPAKRGTMTVSEVIKAMDAKQHVELVYHWAGDVWQAWSAHHDWARDWLSKNGAAGGL